jgi:hypothetical protein
VFYNDLTPAEQDDLRVMQETRRRLRRQLKHIKPSSYTKDYDIIIIKKMIYTLGMEIRLLKQKKSARRRARWRKKFRIKNR